MESYAISGAQTHTEEERVLQELRESVLREIRGNDELRDEELLSLIDRQLERGQFARTTGLSERIRYSLYSHSWSGRKLSVDFSGDGVIKSIGLAAQYQI